jgi:hypothetical protein
MHKRTLTSPTERERRREHQRRHRQRQREGRRAYLVELDAEIIDMLVRYRRILTAPAE